MATSESPSIQKISDDFFQRKVRAEEDGSITTEVTEVRLYPFEEEWWLRIKTGEPFVGKYLRVPLGNTRADAIDKIIGLYPKPIESLNQLTFESVTIGFDSSHTVQTNHPEKLELETAITVNGYDAFFCDVPQMKEYHFDNRSDSEEIQKQLENAIILYQELDQTTKNGKEVIIDSVEAIRNNLLIVRLEVLDDKYLPIIFKLPSSDSIAESPVSEFIDKVGCGRIENLEDEFVYIYEKDASKSVIGLDTRFELYGMSASQLSSSDTRGLFGSVF